ncbi:MAG TPA: hypothetical protein VNG51_01265 [Ktedonobacteraceae bacterium]|nr:hypothetical protein [Ktedonobacteraceae bacterium]
MMKKTSPDTHQACRSLLQKAVRRRNIPLVEKVARHLNDIKDTAWLKRRTAVIVFEECWPMGSELRYPLTFEESLRILKLVAESVKMKDATGLGSLAYELSEGATSILTGEPEDRHIKWVAQAIKNPEGFWKWAIENSSANGLVTQFVLNTKEAQRRGGWPWDLAFMQAAAYLAVTEEGSLVCEPSQTALECPLWVALDKHTSQGKEALRKAAQSLKIPYRQLTWINFYCESALTNESTQSYWWSREVTWRLNGVGLTIEQAKNIWQEARIIVEETLKEETRELEGHFTPDVITKEESQQPDQLSLFS